MDGQLSQTSFVTEYEDDKWHLQMHAFSNFSLHWPVFVRVEVTMMTLRASLPTAVYYQHPMPQAHRSLQEHQRASLVSINQIYLEPSDLQTWNEIYGGCLRFNARSLTTDLPGGKAIHSSNSADIKREDKEDDENSSIADKSEEEKKDSKASRNRTRYGLSSVMFQY